MNDRERMHNPTPPAPDRVAAENVANAATVINAAQQANLKKIQAQSMMWQCVGILLVVFALGMIVPTLFFCWRLVEVIRTWTP